nr:mobile mystery protein A [Actinomycetota bacterium]
GGSMAQSSVAAQRAARRALDRRLPQLRDARRTTTSPHGGWVRAIRDALGMSAANLADRMGTVETSVLSLERNEVARKARLDTLERAADALNCDLVFALVPRQSLEEMVEQRAQARAAAMLGVVGHSMLLEDQQVSSAATQDQLQEQTARLRERRGLWRDE